MKQTRIHQVSAAITMAFLVVALIGLPMPASAMLAPADDATQIQAQRTQDVATLQRVLETKVVAQRLQDLGLSSDDVVAKLSKLPDGQLHQVAVQIDSVFAAGDHYDHHSDAGFWAMDTLMSFIVAAILIAGIVVALVLLL